LRPLADGFTGVRENGLNGYRTTGLVIFADENLAGFWNYKNLFLGRAILKSVFGKIRFLSPVNSI
jgi:hypothetical protein